MEMGVVVIVVVVRGGQAWSLQEKVEQISAQRKSFAGGRKF